MSRQTQMQQQNSDVIAQLAADYAGDTQSFSASAAVYANANDAQQDEKPRHSQADDASTSSTLLDVFTLKPANLPALESMCRLSEATTRQPLAKSYNHARQFIQPDPPQTIASALGLRDTSPLSVQSSFATGQDDDDDDSSLPPAQPSSASPVSHSQAHNAVVSPCSWRVSLKHVIRDPKLGWVLGRHVEQADLLLKPIGHTIVRRVHAAFRYDQSGQLHLYAFRSGVTLDGTTLAPNHALTLHAERHNIGIADMSFAFQSARRHHEDSAFRQILQHWADELSLYIHPHKHLCATPKHVDILAGRYRVVAVAGVGGFHSMHDGRTTIFAGADVETGTAVAIKTCKRFDLESAKVIAGEEAIYADITSAMPASPSVADFILRLHAVVPQSKALAFEKRDTIHFVFTPLADSDLHRHDFGAQGHLDMSVAIAQCLLAVQWLHSIEWIHRDIKPGNIGVRSNPFRIVLLDLAQAINTRTSPDACIPNPGSCGTLGYLAPELENAVFCPSPASPRYNAKVDIFALGIIALDLLCPPPLNKQQVKWVRIPNPFLDEHGQEYQNFISAVQHLRRSNQDSKDFLVSQMLDPNPTRRLNVDGALRHPFLEPLVSEQRMELIKAKEAQSRPGEKRQRNET